MYLDKNDVPQMILNAYPSYSGKKFKIDRCDKVSLEGAYWSGGTRSEYKAVSLDTGVVGPADHRIQNPFRNPVAPTIELPRRTAIIEHVIFRGKDMGLVIHARPEDLAPLLPEVCELTKDQKIVLKYTKSYKSSYGGVKNYRLHMAEEYEGMTSERWESAKQLLIESKHLNKAGAITTKGRNAVSV